MTEENIVPVWFFSDETSDSKKAKSDQIRHTLIVNRFSFKEYKRGIDYEPSDFDTPTVFGRGRRIDDLEEIRDWIDYEKMMEGRRNK